MNPAPQPRGSAFMTRAQRKAKRGKIEKSNAVVSKASVKKMMEKSTKLKFDAELCKYKPFRVRFSFFKGTRFVTSLNSETGQARGGRSSSGQTEGTRSGEDADQECAQGKNYAQTSGQSQVARMNMQR